MVRATTEVNSNYGIIQNDKQKQTMESDQRILQKRSYEQL